MAAKCVKKTVNIHRKGSRKIIASFTAHKGSGCKPRAKSSYKTGHLREYKAVMAQASKQCRKAGEEPFTKPFGKCIKQAFRSRGLINQRA